MFDDFLVRALIGGLGVALVAGPLGCFVVWRRLAYFGDTLSHSALLGVALALLFDTNITLVVFLTAVMISVALLVLKKIAPLSSDALLGLLAHSVLAIGLIVLSFMTWVRVDLMGFLFGDILAVSKADLAIIWGGGAAVLGVLALIWRGLFCATVSRDIAQAEGLHPARMEFIFMILMALVIAISMKIVGVLLITALLIIPAATARQVSRSPEQMAMFAVVVGIVAVSIGLTGSFHWDTPTGPSIVASLISLFVFTVLAVRLIRTVTEAKFKARRSIAHD